MNIKKTFKFWACCALLASLFCCKACLVSAAARITISSPSSEISFGENISIEGSALNLNDNYVRLKIEPFIEKKDFKAVTYLLPSITGNSKKT
jgi:hypothetical protein